MALVASLGLCTIPRAAENASPISPGEVKETAKAKNAADATKYIKVVSGFLDTMIRDGADRYGPEHSPMFCSTLDVKTHNLPDKEPPLLPGQRSGDRAYPGGNLQHDMLTLLAMYHLSAITGDDRYAQAADACLEFFLRRCAPVGNGLFPCGEHAFWDFRKETVARPVHEDLGLIPREFLDRMWQINPRAVERHIRALREHIVNEDRWLWNRHATILGRRVTSAKSFPRHGGFYVYDWCYLYAKTRDAELMQLAKRTAQAPWLQRHPTSGHIPYWMQGDGDYPGGDDKAFIVPVGSLSYGLSLLRANELLGGDALSEFDEIGRAAANSAIRPGTHDPKNGVVVVYAYNDGTPYDCRASYHKDHWTVKYGFWNSKHRASHGFAFSDAERFAILCLCAYRLGCGENHLQFAKDVWEFYNRREMPKDRKGISPGKLGGLMALSLDLYDLTGEEKYLLYARTTADWAVEGLYANGLIRAASGVDYYEASSGAGGLVLELLRLHLILTGNNYPLPRNYWDS